MLVTIYCGSVGSQGDQRKTKKPERSEERGELRLRGRPRLDGTLVTRPHRVGIKQQIYAEENRDL